MRVGSKGREISPFVPKEYLLTRLKIIDFIFIIKSCFGLVKGFESVTSLKDDQLFVYFSAFSRPTKLWALRASELFGLRSRKGLVS